MFATSCVFAIITILALLFLPTKFKIVGEAPRQTVYNQPPEPAPVSFYNLKKLGYIPLVLCVLFLIPSFFTHVPTRSIGIPTSFGKPTGATYGSGLHFKAPWVSVSDVDATIHPEEYKGKSCIYVKIADGGSACVTLAYRWRINPKHADVAYADYRNSDTDIDTAIRKALVSTNVKAAINEVLGTYDPLSGSDLKADMTPEELANVKVNVVPDYEKLNAEIQANVERKISNLGGLINIQSVTISYIALPDSTQNRINAFNQAVQNTKIALQEVATKIAQARANDKLQGSLKDPNVLVSKCLDGLIAGDITNEPGFSCWAGGSAVVIPGTK